MIPVPKAEGSSAVAQRVSFDPLRYANCWEDSALLVEALEPSPGRHILSIASAGDNSLHLLSHGAAVTAVDLSAAQLACLALRVTAIRRLNDREALAFLGFFDAGDRLSTYAGLRDDLPESAGRFWDANPGAIAGGIIHAGKFERYFRLFRTRLLPMVHRRRTVMALLADRHPAERVGFYAQVWDTWRWRLMFKVFFSRFVMGHLGRDPEFFRFVQGSVSGRILSRARYGLTMIDPHRNPYLRYILTGGFEGAMPDWTRAEVLDGIRRHADRLTLVQGGIEDAALHRKTGYDAFNLSDIFEYLDASQAESLYGQLLAQARPKARLAYWNMLVPRACPQRYRDRVEPLEPLSAGLFARDRAFFYSAFHVDAVRET